MPKKPYGLRVVMPFISLSLCTVVLYITCVAHGLMLHVPHALSALLTDLLGVLHTLVSERRAWCFTCSCVWQASCLAWYHSSRTTFFRCCCPSSTSSLNCSWLSCESCFMCSHVRHTRSRM